MPVTKLIDNLLSQHNLDINNKPLKATCDKQVNLNTLRFARYTATALDFAGYEPSERAQQIKLIQIHETVLKKYY